MSAERPLLVLVTGLPCAGKSTLARQLAAGLELPYHAKDELKERLFEAHRRGELELARADLVAAMDPALVAASEMFGGGARFHFIVRGAS